MLPQQFGGSEDLERRNVAGAREHRVRLDTLIGAGPMPDADPAGAMPDRGRHVEPLRRGLFPSDDHVHIIAASQAVIGDGQQRVRVRR